MKGTGTSMKNGPKEALSVKKETFTQVNDGIALFQDPEGLTFGTDALLLAAFVKTRENKCGAEFGCGSGIVSMLLAKREKLKTIDAWEVQPYYADLAARNVDFNRLSDKISVRLGDIREGREEYDVIFTNPPYMKTDCGKRNLDDGKYVARHEVCGDIDAWLEAAARQLKYGGEFYCVYRPDRAIDLLCAMRGHSVEPKRLLFVHPTVDHKPCLMLVMGKRGGRPGCELLRPLILQTPEGQPTKEAEAVYSTGAIPE